MDRSASSLLGGPAAVVLAALPAAWMWGFTVDDALIPVRYARHLAAGLGYRFNAGGPVTDGVTPLPWAPLLSPLARADALDVLARAKALGLLLVLATAFAWGAEVRRTEAPDAAKAAAFASLFACVPLAAHAVSGMETALAIALATAAALAHRRPFAAAGAAGLCAAFRPEMAPWAVTYAFFLARGGAAKAGAALLALLPFAACVAVRFAVFGRGVPLAVWAKPSDLEHGVIYAGAAALAVGAPLLACMPLAFGRAPANARALAIAGLVHWLTVTAVGGDWMPFARLVVPIVPGLLLASVVAAPFAKRWSLAVRAVAALGLQLYVAIVAAPAGRTVMRDRTALVQAALPYLQNARIVAALDVGWVSAATEADLVDLAGLTDPDVAVLPGGHTSKRVDAAFLLGKRPDVLLLYADAPVEVDDAGSWRHGAYGRAVEARLARSDVIAAHFAPRAFLPLGTRGAGYVVLARTSTP